MGHIRIVEEAKASINKVFSDRSVDPEETLQSLNDLSEEIDILIDSLDLPDSL